MTRLKALFIVLALAGASAALAADELGRTPTDLQKQQEIHAGFSKLKAQKQAHLAALAQKKQRAARKNKGAKPAGDWSKWKGHPGWGAANPDNWLWDGEGNPHWTGWSSFGGSDNPGACYAYYDRLHSDCLSDSDLETSACSLACQKHGDEAECSRQCDQFGTRAYTTCGYHYNAESARCAIMRPTIPPIGRP